MANFNSDSLFSEGPLLRRLVAFALPLMALNLLQYVYQTVDMVVVGHVVGEAGLVAISNATNAAYLVSAFVMGLATGGGVAVARAVGADDVPGQRSAYAATLLSAVGTAGLLALAGAVLARPAFAANAVPPVAFDAAVAYTQVVCTGCAGSFLLNAAVAFLKAHGDARTPLLLVGMSALVNVALDLALVGPAGLGVEGAAYATVIAQGVAAAGALVVAWRRYPGARVLAGRGRAAGAFGGLGDGLRLGASVAAVLRVGMPAAAQMAVVNLSYALVTGLLNRYGTDVAAAAGVGLQISTVAGLPCWAVGQAITTAAAQNMGAALPLRACEVVRLGARLNVGVTTGVQVLVQLLAPAVVAAYGCAPGSAAHDLAVLYLRITCSVNGLFYAAMFSFDSFALAAGSPRLVLANSLVDAFAVRFGLAFLLSGVLGCGFVGIFVAQAASPVVPALIGRAYVRRWSRLHLGGDGPHGACVGRPRWLK
ncbi:MATE family efflux transporter [Gordonibacter sp. An230]|uniref:MATE family efflux transporter n=1 Tax=Gordonibacter sp. An230 TaxID=1965592 RepID=UPI000B3A1EF2|nr:MATE family efflux transporter [Gordonibacter sp. An230]OUO91329.1 MATE family efflux transporter [Gordonibacter sp. An230]